MFSSLSPITWWRESSTVLFWSVSVNETQTGGNSASTGGVVEDACLASSSETIPPSSSILYCFEFTIKLLQSFNPMNLIDT